MWPERETAPAAALRMNAYPTELVAQLQPCMLVSGLVRREGSSAPTLPAFGAVPAPLDAYAALCTELRTALERRGRIRVWSPPDAQARFRTVFVPSGHVPPPPKTRPGARLDEHARRALASLPARSPLSPLQPSGPLFPDGIIAPSWVRKHWEYVPGVYVAVCALDEAAADDALIAALAALRAQLWPRAIKLAVVLLCRREELDDGSLEARLSHIRRSAGLDTRASLFVLADGAQVNMDSFVANLQSAVIESGHEHYWEHAKHVRRNRARYPPPPSVERPVLAAAASAGLVSTSTPTLTREGWSVRALYKLAVLAELQGELGEAFTLSNETYELLVDVCLANTRMLPPRTKRWAEAKVLADTLSLKICKLCLYRQDTTRAVAQFTRHTRRFAELSTGWGIGDSTFEFWNWLSKQCHAFGDLVQLAQRASPGTRALKLPVHAPSFAPGALHPRITSRTPASTAAPIAFSPADLLSEPGAYFYLAALCTLNRAERFARLSADAMPEALSRSVEQERGVDVIALAVSHLDNAADAFQRMRHTRHMLFMNVRAALIHGSAGRQESSLRVLLKALRVYRRERWRVPLLALVLHAAQYALDTGDVEVTLPFFFELLQPSFPPQLAPWRARVLDTLAPLAAAGSKPAAPESTLAASPSNSSSPGPNPAAPPESGQAKTLICVDAAAVAPLLQVHAVFAQSSAEPSQRVPFQIVIRASDGIDALWYKTGLASLRLYVRDSSVPFAEVRCRQRGGAPSPISAVGNEAQVRTQAQNDQVDAASDGVPENSPPVFLHLGNIDTDTLPDNSADTLCVDCDNLHAALRGTLVVDGSLCAAYGLVQFDKVIASLATSHATCDLPFRIAPGPSEWLVQRNAGTLRVPLAPRLYPTVLRVEPPTVAVHVSAPSTALCGEIAEVTVTVKHAPPSTTLLLAFSDSACAAGGAFLQNGEPHAFVTLQTTEVASMPARMPQVPGDFTFLAQTSVSERVSAQVEHQLRVSAPFMVRVATNWGPAKEEPRRGHVTTDITYVGDSPIDLVDARIYPRENAGVTADEPLALQATLGSWLPHDTAVLTTPLCTAAADANQPTAGAELALHWQRAGRVNEVSESRIGLPPLTPAPASRVRVEVSGPAKVSVGVPITLYLALSNSSDQQSSDVYLNIDAGPHCEVSGPTQRLVSSLLPQESRMIPFRVSPLTAGRLPLPRVAASERITQGGQHVPVAVPVEYADAIEVV